MENKDVGQVNNDHLLLMSEIERSFGSFMRSVLVEFELFLPHRANDGSLNQITFSNLRRKLLRSGNDRVRLMREYLRDYSVNKVYDSQKVVLFENKGKVN